MLRDVVDAVLAAPPRLGDVRVLAIDGPSASGKTALATRVRDQLRARAIPTAFTSTDDFATWDDPVAWWPRLADGVLRALAADAAGGYRAMDWTGGAPRLGAWVRAPVPRVLVLEGVSAGRASVRPALSRLYWVRGPDAGARLERAARREGESCRAQLRGWQEFERGWFAIDRAWQHADAFV